MAGFRGLKELGESRKSIATSHNYVERLIGLRLAFFPGQKWMVVEDIEELAAAARQLQHVTALDKLRHAERVSFWLNVYNALSGLNDSLL